MVERPHATEALTMTRIPKPRGDRTAKARAASPGAGPWCVLLTSSWH